MQSRDDAPGAGRGNKEGEMAEKNKNQTAQAVSYTHLTLPTKA